MSTLVWFDGAVVPAGRHLLSPLDRGFTVGDGVFETCAVVDRQPFALTRHLSRLLRSAAAVGLPEPSLGTIRAAVDDLIQHADDGPGRLRVTWTAGTGAVGSARADGEPTLVVTLVPEGGARPSGSPAGADVVVVPWVRNERSPLVGVKSTSYAENVLALEHARRHGGTEAVLANTRGELCEGAATNVFVESDGVLLTPPLSSGCLPGVTRELVLEWGRNAGVPIEEVPIPLRDFQTAGHAAVTSSMRGIVAVRSIDGRPLATGGATRQMADVFAGRFAQDMDP
ncbi:aminotransferase class IV [Georgenia sunbinii]|uniref:aminotransferase class IV n=1 Tax=Georgenia sunbinii TaxID=3117728 RepID=UPI002F25FAE7